MLLKKRSTIYLNNANFSQYKSNLLNVIDFTGKKSRAFRKNVSFFSVNAEIQEAMQQSVS